MKIGNWKLEIMWVGLVIGILAIGTAWLFTPANAAISGCSATVSPSSVNVNWSGTLSFTVTNNDSTASIQWVKITPPHDNFSVGESIYTPVNIAPGSPQTFNISVLTLFPSDAQSWTVEASDAADGSSPTTCGGDTAVAIVGDSTAPVLSGITAADVTQTTASIRWTTDEAASTVVRYGLTSSYGTTKSSGTLSTSHMMNLTGLAAGKTYHYQVESADAVGNKSTSGDKVFTTVGAASSSPSPTPPPASPTPPPSGGGDDGGDSGGGGGGGDSGGDGDDSGGGALVPDGSKPVSGGRKDSGTTPDAGKETPVVEEEPALPLDATPPSVRLITMLEGSYKKAPRLSGSATDNKAVTRVYYSVDGGHNWLPVRNIAGAGTGRAFFSFTPAVYEDDNYDIRVRAVDSSGNHGYSSAYVMVVDTMPPVIGPVLYTAGAQVMNAFGNLPREVLVNTDQRVALSALGGPIEIDITAMPEGSGEELAFSMSRDTDSGLWMGAMSFPEEGIYTVSFRAKDGADNITERQMGRVRVIAGGKVTHQGKPAAGAEVAVWRKDAITGRFDLWRAEAFGQHNPQITGRSGGFGYILPPGQYYISVTKKDLRPFKSRIFSLDRSTTIFSEISMSSLKYYSLGVIELPLPPLFWPEVAEINPGGGSAPAAAETSAEQILSVNPEEVEVEGMEGKSSLSEMGQNITLFSLLAHWSPQAGEQLSQLSRVNREAGINALPVLLQSSPETAELLRQRGRYDVKVWADPTGGLADMFGATNTPFHAAVSPDGRILSTASGVLSAEEIREMLGL